MPSAHVDVRVTVKPPVSGACSEVGCPGCTDLHWIVTATTDPVIQKGPSRTRAITPRRNR